MEDDFTRYKSDSGKLWADFPREKLKCCDRNEKTCAFYKNHIESEIKILLMGKKGRKNRRKKEIVDKMP